MPDHELIEFLKRQLDADEALAFSVIERNNARWDCPSSALVAYCDDEYPLNTNDRDVAEHIARHDPARIVGDTAARRYLLAELTNITDEREAQLRALHLDVDLLLRLLAVPYAWNEDWQPRWEVPHLDDYAGDPNPRVVVGEVVHRAKELPHG